MTASWDRGLCHKGGNFRSSHKKWFANGRGVFVEGWKTSLPKNRLTHRPWVCHDDMRIVSALQKTLYEVNFKGIICPAGSMWIITVPSFPQRVSAALLSQFTKSARVCGILFNSRSEIPWSTYRQFVPIYPSAPRTFSQGGNKDEECPRTTTCRGSSLHFA
jgi:hypothetical protein